MTATTTGGTTISLLDSPAGRLVILENQEAPVDMRRIEAGRIGPVGFQPAPMAEFGMRPEVLRAIADLIEEAN